MKNSEERLWYAGQAVANGWSRNVLVIQIESGLYHRQGKAFTNFQAPALRAMLPVQDCRPPGMPKRKHSTADLLPIPVELIARRIYRIRGEKVMLDADLAELYQVPTFRLNEAVKRNRDRFPPDFMFQLSKDELENWRSQIAMSNPGTKMGLRRPPYAFTEHGVAMPSSVLNSKRAVQMNILIIRAFVQIRELLATNKDLAARVERLEAARRNTPPSSTSWLKRSKLVPEPPAKRRIGYKTNQ